MALVLVLTPPVPPPQAVPPLAAACVCATSVNQALCCLGRKAQKPSSRCAVAGPLSSAMRPSMKACALLACLGAGRGQAGDRVRRHKGKW